MLLVKEPAISSARKSDSLVLQDEIGLIRDFSTLKRQRVQLNISEDRLKAAGRCWAMDAFENEPDDLQFSKPPSCFFRPPISTLPTRLSRNKLG